jgi:hypothetical protein
MHSGTQRRYRAVTFREGHFRGGILEVSKERGSGRFPVSIVLSVRERRSSARRQEACRPGV